MDIYAREYQVDATTVQRLREADPQVGTCAIPMFTDESIACILRAQSSREIGGCMQASERQP